MTNKNREEKMLLVRGACQHNLKNVTVEIPREKLVVITGVSGSGKSSLAFDTIYAEGQRRYMESLSAYARQFLDQLDKPEVELIEGLSPTIAIEQRSLSKNPRSTVGTVTEIYDHLRLLYARIGRARCWDCGQEIARQTVQQMVDRVMELPEGAEIGLLSTVVLDRKGQHTEVLAQLRKDGFTRVRIDGVVRYLDEELSLAKTRKHTIEVYVDRLKVKPDLEARLADSLETCLHLGAGTVLIDTGASEPILMSEHYSCPDCGNAISEIEPRTFSFNSPHGACPQCEGLGLTSEIDEDLVIPDPSLTLRNGAFKPWATSTSQYMCQMFETAGAEYGFDLDTPWCDLPERARQMLLYGSGDREFNFNLVGKKGRGHSFTRPFEGIIEAMKRRYRQTKSEAAREEYSKYMTRKLCPLCRGQRLSTEALHIFIGDRNIADVAALSGVAIREFIDGLTLTEMEEQIGARLLREIRSRLEFLSNVGLDYLTLDRAANTLSGGEGQRIRLATQIGSALVGVLYVLDEPSIGLHARDNERLLETLKRLRDRGNSVLVVEHDEETIRSADHVIDLGPGAGRLGGEVVAQGTAEQLAADPNSITGMYLSGQKRIEIPSQRRPRDLGALVIRGARQNNLQNLTVEIPLGCLVAVTGVSGSGKSSLILDTLYPVLARRLHRASIRAGEYDGLDGVEHINKIIDIDQSPIGRTPRSNPATYTGLFGPIRELFAKLPVSRMRGYKPGRFSFNVKGGRCETCKGDGTIKIEMNFLPDVYVTCDQCDGRRFNRDTLLVLYRGRSISDVLAMTVQEAALFFEAVPKIKKKLDLLEEVGLGYLQLGQPATTLSGGEAQRIKITKELSRPDTGRTVYLLDEPTTGLHFEDIGRLLKVLSRLVDAGNTVVVIEHNLDVIKTADWIIDLGPEGGDGGGQLVACGTPEEIAKCQDSYTGQFLNYLT